MLELTIEENGIILIATFPSGKIFSEVEIANLGRQLFDLVEQTDKLIIDLSRVEMMTTTMTGKLVKLREQCLTQSVELKLCALSPVVRVLFEIARDHRSGRLLANLFSIYENREGAVAAFGLQ